MPKQFDLTRLLADGLKDLNCPGVLCGLNIGGEFSAHSAGTISKKEQDKPFYIYSISKTFTATAVLLLSEMHDGILDGQISQFLSGKRVPDGTTVRQLLNHTGGLSDYSSSREYQEAVSRHPGNPWSYDHLMEVGLKHTPLFKPGQGWSYSNPGYGLLKELIEKISGQEYYAFVERHILKPAGLEETRPFLQPDHELLLLAGEDPSMEGDFRGKYSPGWIATGSFISTVHDVLKFYTKIFSRDILSANSLQQMICTVDVPVVPKPEAGIPSYGLGLMHSRKDPLGDAYGHGGGGPGYTTYAMHFSHLCGTTFSYCLVLNKSLPATPFELGDNLVMGVR